MDDLARGVFVAGMLVFVVAPVGAADDGELRSQERAYIQATAMFITNPSKMSDKWDMESLLKENDDKWKKSNDPVLRALASIEENPELREQYRRSLEKKTSSKTILADIKSNYAADKLVRYRKVIANSKRRKLPAGALPWPICIPFGCCQ
jgi:hypothetical protein